ncbi:MAG: hypothetical protein ABSH22_16330, partial [Tepidisphaeraceae bacterium]
MRVVRGKRRAAAFALINGQIQLSAACAKVSLGHVAPCRFAVEQLESRLFLSTDTWTSAVSGNWNVPGNWSTGLVPGSGDNAVIAVPGVTVTVSDAEAASSVTVTVSNPSSPPTLAITGGSLSVGTSSEIDGGFTLSGGALFIGGGTLTLTGNSVFSGGAIDLDGNSLTNTGSMTWSEVGGSYPSGFFANTAVAGNGATNRDGTFDNQGTVTETNGALIEFSDGTTFQNDVILDFTGNDPSGDSSIVAGGNDAPTMVNGSNATIEKTAGSGTSTIGISVNNQGGTETAGTGTLNVGGGANTGGTYNASTGATVLLNGSFIGSYTGTGGGTVGLGSNIFIGSSYNNGDTATFDFPLGLFQWSADGIDLAGNTLVNSGFMNWTLAGGGYTLGFFGNTAAAGNGGSNRGGTFDNKGTVTQAAAAEIGLADAVEIENENVFDFTGDDPATAASIVDGGDNSGFIDNTTSGLIEKTGGTNTSTIGITVNNQGGTELAATGTLNVGAGANTDGSLYNAMPGAIVLLNGSFTGTFTGSGGGTVGLGSNIFIGSSYNSGTAATFDFPAGMFQWSANGIDIAGNTLTNTGFMNWSLVGGGYTTGFFSNTASAGNGSSDRGGLFVNMATITVAGGAEIGVADGLELENEKTLNFTGNASIVYSADNASYLLNTSAGTIETTGGAGTSTIGIPVDNTGGTEQVNTGTLNPAAGADAGGVYNAATGATLLLNGSFTGTIAGTGGGTIALGSNIFIGSSYNSGTSATFDFPQGMFQWSAFGIDLAGNTLTNTGYMNWTLVGSGYTGGLFGNTAAAGNGSSDRGGILDNQGTITEAAGANIGMADNLELENEDIFDFTGDASIVFSGNQPSDFVNTDTGLLEMTAGSGTSSLAVTFNNNGGVIADDSGTLSLINGASEGPGETNGATYNISSGATILIDGYLLGSFTGTGSGLLTLGGNIFIGTSYNSGQQVTFDFAPSFFQWTSSAINLAGNTLINTATMTINVAGLGIFGNTSIALNGATNRGGTLDNKGTIIEPSGG